MKLKKDMILIVISIISFSLGIFILLWSSDINNKFVNTFGTEGRIVIKEIRPTNITINDLPIIDYEVVLYTNEHKIVKASLSNENSNGGSVHLEQGKSYSVKYIPGDEQNISFPIR